MPPPPRPLAGPGGGVGPTAPALRDATGADWDARTAPPGYRCVFDPLREREALRIAESVLAGEDPTCVSADCQRFRAAVSIHFKGTTEHPTPVPGQARGGGRGPRESPPGAGAEGPEMGPRAGRGGLGADSAPAQKPCRGGL